VTAILSLIQAAVGLGLDRDDLLALADWGITRFTPGHSDADKANLRANLQDYIERGVRLRDEIAEHEAAKAARQP
jgi:hypothetical protein